MKIRNIFLPMMMLGSVCSHAQNVGIGIQSPLRGRLEVAGAVGVTTALFGSDTAGISFQRNNPAIGFNHYNNGSGRYIDAGHAMLLSLDMANGALSFESFPTGVIADGLASPATKRLVIHNNGNTVLNGTQNSASLFVNGLSFATTARFLGTQHATVFSEGQTDNTIINAGKTGSDVLINDINLPNTVYIGGGPTLVGINTETPTSALYVKQNLPQANPDNVSYGVILVNPGFLNWEFRVVKNLTDPASDYYVYYNEQYRGNFFYADGLYYPFSDERMKRNIKSLSGISRKLMQLTPVSYRFKDFPGVKQRDIGFSAQQLNMLFPSFVHASPGRESGYPVLDKVYSVDYSGLSVLAVKMIQEQQTRIAGLRERNGILRRQIEELESLNR